MNTRKADVELKFASEGFRTLLPKGKFKSIVARHVKPETVDQQGPGIPQSKLNMKNFVIQRLYFTWQRNMIWVLALQIRMRNVS